jgi:hypothetical protein
VVRGALTEDSDNWDQGVGSDGEGGSEVGEGEYGGAATAARMSYVPLCSLPYTSG